MKLIAVRTCPVWEDQDGNRRVGRHYDPLHPQVIGWCNVLVIELYGERYELLGVHETEPAR